MVYNCSECDSPQNFVTIEIRHTENSDGLTNEFTFASCDRCHTPALFYRFDFGEGYEQFGYSRLWPVEPRYIRYALPDIVRDSYEDAVKSENAKAYMAAAVMVRRSLEAVCKEYDPKCKTVYSGLQNMLKNGVISQELMDWATELRVIGNKGAHATSERISRTEAKEAIDFLQAILEIFYDLRPKFKEMQDRKAKAK